MKKVSLILNLLLASTGYASPVEFGPGGSNGGSGYAIEVVRATHDFIDLVRENPSYFPGVDPEHLASLDPSIIMTEKKIETCDSLGTLEAYSSLEKNRSVFNLKSWIAKESWQEKVFLAGHERLVLAEYEKSNRYHLSENVFKIPVDHYVRSGRNTDLCRNEKEQDVCNDMKKIEMSVVEALDRKNKGELQENRFLHYMRTYQKTLKILKLELVGLRLLALQNSAASYFMTQASADRRADEIRHEVQMSFDKKYSSFFRWIYSEERKKEAEEVGCVQFI